MDGNKKKMDGNKETSYQRRRSDIAKKTKELSILSDTETLFLSFDPSGKAELVLGLNTNFEDMVNRFVNLSPKERYESKLEGIKALKEAFKKNSDHEIDVQPLMKLGGSGTSHAIEQGQQSSTNMTEEIQRRQNLCAQLVNERLNIMEAARQAGILLKAKRAEISKLREARASASTSAVQHSAPLNGNDLMNQGTNLLQPDMNSGSNSDPVSDDLLMAAPPGSEEEPFINLPERDPYKGN